MNALYHYFEEETKTTAQMKRITRNHNRRKNKNGNIVEDFWLYRK